MTAWLKSLAPAALRVAALCAGLAACAAAPEGRAPLVPAPEEGGRHAVTYLPLTEAGPAEGQHRGYFSSDGAGRVSLAFLPHGPMHFRVAAVCDGRTRVRAAQDETQVPGWQPAGREIALRVEPRQRARVWLDLEPGTTQCDLTVTPGGRPSWRLALAREETALPQVARLDAPLPLCAGTGRDALERAFMASGDLAITCPVAAGEVRLLSEGIEALQAKIEALTGTRLSPEALEAGDPMVPLDWSNAPDLDLIYVNYLNMNADFAGYLMARMLAWHAARGTVVRILVADVMLTDTDRRLFEGLAAQYPNVQVQPYRLPASAARGLEGQLGRIHRVSHVKLFATVSRSPGRSRAMVGGRNIHEGYFFTEPRDLSGYSFLHHYDPSRSRLTGAFTAYDDFEVELRSDAAVRMVAQHMGMLWHRDHDTQALRLPAPGVRELAAHEGMLRDYLSVPFTDGAAQEAYFIGLLDAAEQSIRIVTPYLNPPPGILDALERARARGVRVDLVTTTQVDEALDFMISGMNRVFANSFGDWVHFFDYRPPASNLHAKLLVIDGRVSIVGSANINERSFLHDLENGLVFYDRAISARLDAVIQSYVDRSTRRGPGFEVPVLARLLARIGPVRRAF